MEKTPPPNSKKLNKTASIGNCEKGKCQCTQVPRREFLRVSSLVTGGATLLGASSLPIMAGPFEENDYLKTIPTDKKLDPSWVRSLYDRGEKKNYSAPKELNHIGMPVGGFFAGTVYLSGDGRLWLWDVFNRDQMAILPRETEEPEGFHGSFLSGGLNYLNPAPITQPFNQAFSLKIGNQERALDQTGFQDITFDGRYPIGQVTYRDKDCPVRVKLQAFSPFIPQNLDDSSLPATVMSYKLTNTTSQPVQVELVGVMENPVCPDSRNNLPGKFRNRIVKEKNFDALVCSVESKTKDDSNRPDILFEDFEDTSYSGWISKGKSFGDGPVPRDATPEYQGKIGGQGEHIVNSHASASGNTITSKDGKRGKLTSRLFKIERSYINLWIGGGAHQQRTCVNIFIDGKTVVSITGESNNRMVRRSVNVGAYQGQMAQIEIVDDESGPWGNIGVDHIVFSDKTASDGALQDQPDFGTMTLALLGKATDATSDTNQLDNPINSTSDFGSTITGSLSQKFTISSGASKTVSFTITWHFPNFKSKGCNNALVGHYYAARFGSALQVTRYMDRHFKRLSEDTRQWVSTWYDSTLPYWFLDRTMANTSILATATCHRFRDGRFWAWEGIGCCHGTCTHVWHYAQAPGRLFPELERLEREQANFGIGLHKDGGIGMRTSLTGANEAADDGQCGRILGMLREHQMSADDKFLRRLWPNVKKAIQYLINKDANADGMIEGAQPNTLDAAWYGKVSFLASLYLATLTAGEKMAREMDDHTFADQCAAIAKKGSQSILELYNGKYFIQIEDPNHRKEVGVGPGCYIDQIFGQTWAHWVGLGHLFDRDKQLSALRALWKYNFVPDIGVFRKEFPRGRWYANEGDAGLIMCSWPDGGQNPAFKDHWQYMYFNECMTGFEWQAAAHMIWEGEDQPDILQYGLAVSRAIHDRYDARLRNPYNEIECSDHYARAMASFGAYQAACGFTYHGPKGQLEFNPRLSSKNFRCAFVAAEGWGTFRQKQSAKNLQAGIEWKHGAIAVSEIKLSLQGSQKPTKVQATLKEKAVPTELEIQGNEISIRWKKRIKIEKGETLSLQLS